MAVNGAGVGGPSTIPVDRQRRDENDSPLTDHRQPNGGAAITFQPLRPENVRWFYKSDSKRWTKFDGFDSLNIEHRYRVNFGNEAEVSCLNGKYDGFVGVRTVVVRGGLYEVDLLEKKCTSIFWPGKWFTLYYV